MSGTFGDIKNLTAKSCTSLAEYFNLNKHIVPLLLKHPQFRNYIEIKELDLPKIHVEVIRVECTEEQKFVTLIETFMLHIFRDQSQIEPYTIEYFALRGVDYHIRSK